MGLQYTEHMPGETKTEAKEEQAQDSVPTGEASTDNIFTDTKAELSKKKSHRVTNLIQTATRKSGRPKANGERSRQRFTNAENALVMNSYNAGMAPSNIAALVHSTPNTIRHKVWKFKQQFKELDNVVDFKLARSDLISATELSVLKSLNIPGKLDAATIGELAKAYSVLHTANRLERNLTTSNSQSVTFTGTVDDVANYRNNR